MYVYNKDSFGTHYEIILSIVRSTSCESYLELGIYTGDLIGRVAPIVKRADAVDTADHRNYHNFNFHQQTTDAFFQENTHTYDIIFIDADHAYDSVVKDFENALKILNRHGIIFIHDTDPMFEYLLQPSYCNDSYRMCEYLRTHHPELDVINLPASEAGLMIINRRSDHRFRSHPSIA